MLYVSQSLGKDEKIVHVGRFHPIYRFNAVSWVLLGLVGTWIILHTGLYMDVQASINANYPNLPEELKEKAWNTVIKAKGGTFSAILNLHWVLKLGAVLCFLSGLFVCLRMLITEMVTEIVVTNTRLIYKTGLVARYVGEISIDRIEGVNVIQGALGRILGYGRLIVRGMGVGEVILPPIDDPIKFRRAIEKAKTL